MVDLWFATDATVEVGDLIAAVSGTATLDSQMANEVDFSAEVKDVKVSGGERDVEAVKLMGYNELLHENRAAVREVSFTMIGKDVDTSVFLTGAKIAVGATGYNRITGGEKAANDRVAKAILVKLADGTNNVSVLLNKSMCTTAETSLDPDGHLELNLTFKCLASNYYEEDDF